jgi:hypothetical protein
MRLIIAKAGRNERVYLQQVLRHRRFRRLVDC